jgi:hypothetical protein
MLAAYWDEAPAAGLTVFGTGGGDSGHSFSPSRSSGDAQPLAMLQVNPARQSLDLIGDLKFVAVHLPLDANQPIEMHTFGL